MHFSNNLIHSLHHIIFLCACFSAFNQNCVRRTSMLITHTLFTYMCKHLSVRFRYKVLCTIASCNHIFTQRRAFVKSTWLVRNYDTRNQKLCNLIEIFFTKNCPWLDALWIWLLLLWGAYCLSNVRSCHMSTGNCSNEATLSSFPSIQQQHSGSKCVLFAPLLKSKSPLPAEVWNVSKLRCFKDQSSSCQLVN